MKPIIQRPLDSLEARVKALEDGRTQFAARLLADQTRALNQIRASVSRAIQFNIKDFGAIGDGVADDAPAINAAMAQAAISASSPAQDFGAIAFAPRGTYQLGSPLIIPNGVGIRGAGPSATVFRAAPHYTASSLIQNQNQDGTQEFAFLESLQVDGGRGLGANCSTAVVDLVSLFINSYVRDVIVLNGSNVGLRFAATNGMGPIFIENVWVVNNGGDNVLVEETPGNSQAAVGLCFVNLTSEHQGSNSSAIHLRGHGGLSQTHFINVHIEQGTAATGRTAITLDGAPHTLIDGAQILADVTTVSGGILITNNIANVGIQINGVYNPNLINPIIRDQLNNATVAAENLPIYLTPDVTFQGGPAFRPQVSGSSLVIKDFSGTPRLQFDMFGRVTGASFFGAGVDMIADATNGRPYTISDHSLARTHGWEYSDASNLRFKYFTGGVNLINFDNLGNTFVYNPTTHQALVTLQSSLMGSGSHAAAPSVGFHLQGEIVFNADPVASGFVGWVCVTAGTPGTWKSFGAISA